MPWYVFSIEASAWKKGLKSSRTTGALIPTPWSRTEIRTKDPSSLVSTATSELGGLNLIALEIKLRTIWRSCSRSARTKREAPPRQWIATWPRAAAGATSGKALPISRCGSRVSRSSASSPASISASWRTELISESRWRPERWMCSAYSTCSAVIAPGSKSRRSAKPITPLSGVRSSWLMLARNSDLRAAGPLQLPGLLFQLRGKGRYPFLQIHRR